MREEAVRRLTLPPGRTPGQELARYKDYLRSEAARLRQLHRAGAGGREVCQARAWVLDLLLGQLWGAVMMALPAGAGGEPMRFALVAIGGYGRGELNPHSDIDIMLLHNLDSGALVRGKVPPRLSALTDGLLFPLWDMGMKVGHSVRSVEDCVGVANTDMQSKTSLLEARWIGGDMDLFRRMESVFLARCVRGKVDEYLAARIADQAARRAKHGGSPTMQEPNIKSGCGGLRDHQNLLWMAFFKYRTRTLADLENRDLISGEEHGRLATAYDYLLRVRTELHHESNRAADVLQRALQPRIAQSLGYEQRSPVERIEVFMRDVYTHMRHIHLITRTLEQRLALLPDPQQRLPTFRQLFRQGRQRMRRQVVDGFEMVDGEIAAGSRRVFRDQPRRLLRVFLHAQQRGLRLHPDLAQLVRQQLDLVDDDLLADRHGHETFLGILAARGNVAPTLRAMHETGVLGRYLPEFEPLTCLVQHEFYHRYAADEHTLQCIEHLDRVWNAETPPYSGYAGIFQSLERPQVLYLALLLHDAGKAHREANHAVTGGRLAAEVARRMGLDGTTAHALRLLIELHLRMAHISQRRDLDDPAVVRQFAAQVQTPENLKMLTLHTLADSLGTGDRLWNGFKDSLLLQLYRKTSEHISGAPVFQLAEERQREILADQVRRLGGAGFAEVEFRAHFVGLPARYYRIHEAPEILADLRMAHTFLRAQFADDQDPLVPVVSWSNEPDRGCTVLKVCTWDRTGLFGKITGSLTAAGLNILGAQIFTRADQIILDTFTVVDARTGSLAGKEERERFERLLTRSLTGGVVDFEEQIARRPRLPPLYQSIEGGRMPTSLRFDNDTSEACTVLDLETEDHVGLLYSITAELARLGLDISLARVSTERGAALDSFYLTDVLGNKVTSVERLAEVADRLERKIAALSRGG
jgi:[protein-PII] uridylyltransferase